MTKNRIMYSRTPLRISLFGGGTDYPEFFERYPGCVIGTSINQYIYITSLPLSDFGDDLFTLSYRQSEAVKRVDEIEHPVFREVLKREMPGRRHQFTVLADLPAGAGLGSSSSFTVGLLNLIEHIHEREISRYELAKKAIYYERDVLQENVGIQDQIHAAFGGLNRYDFDSSGFKITPIELHPDVRTSLNSSMVLVSTGIQRKASEIAKQQVSRTARERNDRQLQDMKLLVDEATSLLESSSTEKVLLELARMLDESWKIKKSLGNAVSSNTLDQMYTQAKSCGAMGGKLCGAGGGGFFLFLADEDAKANLHKAFPQKCLNVAMDCSGSQVY